MKVKGENNDIIRQYNIYKKKYQTRSGAAEVTALKTSSFSVEEVNT